MGSRWSLEADVCSLYDAKEGRYLKDAMWLFSSHN